MSWLLSDCFVTSVECAFTFFSFFHAHSSLCFPFPFSENATF
uniref:Uncharacterized protein n=1 Tax=Rhizophora mucronata TaxID=61149 RepID=A0A2P2Q338_RHIMU